MKFGTLKIKMPDGRLREYPIDQPSLSIGRASGNELIVEDNSISRRHARLSVESGHLMIEDLNSANGTFIGSQRILPAAASLRPRARPMARRSISRSSGRRCRWRRAVSRRRR